MIPKIIHYCWFGQKTIPEKLQICINSWKKYMPEYEFIRWDESNFDIFSTPWTSEAYQSKKYAFVSDYVRLLALKKYGGIYLDTDVEVLRSFDDFLGYDAFMGFESTNKLTSAVIGAEKNHFIISSFLDFYKNRSFVNSEGIMNNEANVVMMTNLCVQNGLIPNNTKQEINGIHFFPKTYFCPLDFYMNKDFSENTYAVHYFDASWLDEATKRRILKERKCFYKSWLAFKSFIQKLFLYIIKK